MATDDRRTCPIFRIERGTFAESHSRTLNFDYPSLNDDENVFLRVTKLSSIRKVVRCYRRHLLINQIKNLHSSTNQYRDTMG